MIQVLKVEDQNNFSNVGGETIYVSVNQLYEVYMEPYKTYPGYLVNKTYTSITLIETHNLSR